MLVSARDGDVKRLIDHRFALAAAAAAAVSVLVLLIQSQQCAVPNYRIRRF